MTGRAGMLALVIAPLLNGCIASSVASGAWSVATAPVKATSWTADRLTTSQAEADRNYGRKMREAEAREGRERRDWQRHCAKSPEARDCQRYDGYRAGYGR